MLTLEQCRKLLGNDCSLSDVELEALRDAMYKLADVAVETFLEQHPTAGRQPHGESFERPHAPAVGANGRN